MAWQGGPGVVWWDTFGAPLDHSSAHTADIRHKTSELNKEIKVIQINLNKSNSAQLELTHQVKNNKSFICMVTEPATIRKKLSGIPKNYNVLPSDRDNAPRAAIFTSKTVPITEITNLRHRDLTVGLIMCGRKQTALISAYLDIKQDAVPDHLKDAISYCKKRGYSILISADTNSHSKIWGTETNNRGKKWNMLIEDEGLMVHNRGRIPTFESEIGKSIIDVTLSFNLKWELDNWRVLRSYNGTDHNSIHYNIKEAKIEIPKHRNYSKANWNIFTEELEKFYINVPSEITECKLDKVLRRLNKGIDNALDKACPMTKATTIDPHNVWWSPELTHMRREVSNLYDKHKNNKRDKKLLDYYKRKQKEYRKTCRLKQKQQQRYENETVTNEECMAKKVKHLTAKINPQVSTLKKDDGTCTEVGKDTCIEMMTKHFPTHMQVKTPEYSTNKLKTQDIMKAEYKSWINPESVRRVLLKFK